ncbi:MAG: sigma-70 family RNA polymerase sigma factor [Bacteroidota bacterium]
MAAYSTYSDEMLVALLKQEDQRAFDQLFRKLYPALCFFAGRYVPVAAQAEEIVQDTLFKLWQRRNDFDNYQSVKAFLYISTKNACMDGIYSEQRKLSRDHNWYMQQEQMDHNAEENIIQAEVLLEISQAITQPPSSAGGS